MNLRAPHARAFARLALLAALLLATVPTLGRLCGAASPPAGMSTASMAMSPGMAASMPMSMAGGMHHAGMVGHAPHVAPSHGHTTPHEHDADCAYCPLVATTLLAPLLAPTVATATVPAPPAFRIAPATVSARLLGTLGSRGPPRDA